MHLTKAFRRLTTSSNQHHVPVVALTGTWPIRKTTSKRARVALASVAAAALLSTAPVLAQEIELTAKDGSMTLKGDLVGFEDRKYTIRTQLGELVIDADSMDCAGAACPVMKPPAIDFRVTGAQTPSETLLPRLLNAYSAQSDTSVQIGSHPEEGQLIVLNDAEDDPLANVQVVSSTSSSGLVDLVQGDAQMALSTRPPRPNEADAFKKSGLGEIQGKDQEYVMALEGVLIITAPGNPIGAISDEMAARIFSGAVTNWSALGGPDAPIQVYARDAASDTGDAFTNLVMAAQSLQVRDDATIVDSDARLSARVAGDPFGIGFIGFGETGDAKPLAISGACGLRVAPSEFAIKSEQYPLTRRLSAYVAGDRPDQLTGFFEFLNSDSAQQAVADAGFVTQEVATAPLDQHAERLSSAILSGLTAEALPRLQDMVRQMTDARQLSLSFRFVPGTNTLDARSHSDLARLAELLASEDYAGKIVTLASFTEAAANAAQNQPLSVQRGQMILDGLLEIDGTLNEKVTLNMVGYGDIAPLTCSGTVVGQHVNSRVEVWVKEPVNQG